MNLNIDKARPPIERRIAIDDVSIQKLITIVYTTWYASGFDMAEGDALVEEILNGIRARGYEATVLNRLHFSPPSPEELAERFFDRMLERGYDAEDIDESNLLRLR